MSKSRGGGPSLQPIADAAHHTSCHAGCTSVQLQRAGSHKHVVVTIPDPLFLSIVLWLISKLTRCRAARCRNQQKQHGCKVQRPN